MYEEWDQQVFKLRAFFWKHWMVYETSWHVSTDLVVRDMECYCDNYPDQCPFDDYTPKNKQFSAVLKSKVFHPAGALKKFLDKPRRKSAH